MTLSIVLREVTEADLPILFEHQREPEAMEMAAWGGRDRDAFMMHWRTNMLVNPTATNRAIVVDGEVAGHVGSWERDGTRLVGYWLGRAYWGHGIATAVLTELVTRHDRARPLHAHVATRNVGSIRVLEKCGFARVGDAEAGHDGVPAALMRLD